MMYMQQSPPTNRNAEADPYTSNVPTAHTHNLSGRDTVIQPEYSPADTLGVAGAFKLATPNYIYYRIYAEDGAMPSNTPVAPGDLFLGRIKLSSVPPPRTAKTVKRSIAKVENIKDRGSTSLFLTSYSQSPTDDTDKLTILNDTGPGSTPQEPLALLAKMSDAERTELESGRRGGLASAEEPDATPSGIRYMYYQLYADDYEIPSKVSIYPEEPSLGRIRADCIAPPHNPTSIKRCISRVERIPALVNADLFSDTSCDTPLTEGHISILRTDGPGLSPNEPMAIVQAEIQVEVTSIPDGSYVIKSRAGDLYWSAYNSESTEFVYFWETSKMEKAKSDRDTQWDIIRDANGNISMTSRYAPSLWVGSEIKKSAVPIPWRLIPAEGKSFYLTTDMNCINLNPRVPAVQEFKSGNFRPGSMATLKEGNQMQMWEFIRI